MAGEIKKIDSKSFMANSESMKNLDKLKLAMREAPELFEVIKKGSTELAEVVLKVKQVSSEFETMIKQINEFYSRITRDA